MAIKCILIKDIRNSLIHSHGKVGYEGGGGQVHLKGGLLGRGLWVEDGAEHGGARVSGHHNTLHMELGHLQLMAHEEK